MTYLTRLAAIMLAVAAVIILVSRCSEDRTPVPRTFSALAYGYEDSPLQNLNSADYADYLGDEVYSESVLMIDLASGNIICRKEPDKEIFPASLTKLMTSILAIEKLPDINAVVKLDSDMFDYIEKENASTAGFEKEEKVKVIDLMYGVMLSSGAEASIALARTISGTEQKFADLMNEKAKELDMNSTHYVNCTGLHDINHYSSASDTVKLLQYALKNELFRKLFTAKTYATSPTSLHAKGLTLVSTTFRAFTLSGYDSSYILGGKTGFTNEAKLCLTTLALRKEREYLLVTYGAGDGTNTTSYHVMDADAIYKKYA